MSYQRYSLSGLVYVHEGQNEEYILTIQECDCTKTGHLVSKFH